MRITKKEEKSTNGNNIRGGTDENERGKYIGNKETQKRWPLQGKEERRTATLIK